MEGETLSASSGTWTGNPTSYAYQWQDCDTAGDECSSIGGATSSSYKPTAKDVGDTVRVVESRPLSRTKRWALVDVLERAR